MALLKAEGKANAQDTGKVEMLASSEMRAQNDPIWEELGKEKLE